MKKLFLFLIFGSLTLTASARMTHKPTFRPDWTYKAPAPSNGTYLYVTEHGEGSTKREALNQALARVFQSTANRVAPWVTTDEINRAVQSGTDYEVISRNIKVPINKVCEFAVQDPYDYTWTMYILCQVAKAGNITPDFETSEECTKHKIFDELNAKWEQEIQDSIDNEKKYRNKRNAVALVSSTFIPGMGQMLKKQGGSGAAFLLSEIVVFGGGTACYFLGEEQVKIMKNPSSYEEFKQAQNMKNIYNIAMYTAFGVGAAIHISNMVHAWLVTDKRSQSSLTFVPAVIPTNEYSTPNYAMGAGVQIKF